MSSSIPSADDVFAGGRLLSWSGTLHYPADREDEKGSREFLTLCGVYGYKQFPTTMHKAAALADEPKTCKRCIKAKEKQTDDGT